MERLKHIKDSLMACVEGQMYHLESVNTKELGEAIDMIKDLEEAIYYCTITKAMNEPEDKMKHQEYNGDQLYYGGRYPHIPPMYYDGNGNGNNGNTNGRQNYQDGNGGMNRQYYQDGNNNYGNPKDNEKEGRSGRSRRQYMESKKKHHDSATQMRELETYMSELSEDILEMIEEASPEERQYLSKKIATLATKVEAVN